MKIIKFQNLFLIWRKFQMNKILKNFFNRFFKYKNNIFHYILQIYFFINLNFYYINKYYNQKKEKYYKKKMFPKIERLFFRDLMKEDSLNFRMQLMYLILDIPIFLILFFLNAGYGKFYNYNSAPSFLPTISSKTSWIIQESPCIFITIYYIISFF